jgi:restriction system protein
MLALHANGLEYERAPIRAALAKHFDLSQDDLEEMLPSGRQRTFHNRVNWAAVYLVQAGLLDRPGRGKTKITARGREVLTRYPDRIDTSVLEQFPEFQDFLGRAKSTAPSSSEAAIRSTLPQATPEEAIDVAYRELRAALAEEVLGRVLANPPDFFETVVLDVLLAMGYGGSREDAAQRLGRTGDEGLDGEIHEDRLGLDRIYIQAKRWKPDRPVRRPDVQAFVGALQGAQASKGVFITTSRFTDGAIDYVTHVQPRVVLVDGRRLADLMIEYGVGVSRFKSYELKRVDEDYFVDDQDPGSLEMRHAAGLGDKTSHVEEGAPPAATPNG